MTRKSRREIERAVEDLAGDRPEDPSTPTEAAAEACLAAFREEAVHLAYHFEATDGRLEDVPEGYDHAATGRTFEWYVAPEHIPEAFAEDLPARLPRALSIDFAGADT